MKILSTNKKLNLNYEVIETYEAGLELFGTEVKSIAQSNCSINEAFVIFKGNEAYVINMHVAPYFQGNIQNKDPIRNRKLLLHRREIIKISFLVKKERLTIVPMNIYWKNNKIKMKIAICKGKKKYDKRQDLKKKDDKKNMRNFS